MTYEQIEDYLNQVPRFAKKNPLELTKKFYQFIQNLGWKEEKLGKIIHIAGTNGKGSVCSYLNSVFCESGYHVGMFTSPHLITTRERFQIDGKPIDEKLFSEAFDWLEKCIAEYNEQQKQEIKVICEEYIPTYFERLFFMMVYIFINENVEIVIMETGLGGRLDTTNVVEKPVLSIITEIGFDHMAYLGNSLEEIAAEKAGIIKAKIPLVFVDRKKEVSQILTRKANEQGSCCHKVSINEYKINKIQKKSIDFSVCSRYYGYIGFDISTTAVYQVENAAIAVKAVELLKETQNLDKVSKETIKAGIEHMRWPGRMEEVLDGVYIDGAHNEDGVEAFIKSVFEHYRQNAQKGKCYLIFSAVNDKKYDKMIEMLSGLNNITDFVITRIPGQRGVDIPRLKEQFKIYTDKPIHVFEEIQDAFSYCILNKGEDDMVYIVGSLYLAGLVEALIKNKKGLVSE